MRPSDGPVRGGLRMKRGSLRDALVSGGFWAAWLLLAAALMIPAPSAAFCLSFLAVTASIFPLAFGSTRKRIVAAIALVIGLSIAFSLADSFRNDPYLKKQRKGLMPAKTELTSRPDR